MKQFLFSVIMAVYNVEPFLAESIDSVIAQDIGFEENIQLILVDDGAKDRSGAICDEYAEKYPDNIFVYHKANGGVSSARNLGLSHAAGKYLNFLDSDDKLSADAMRCARDFFEKFGDQTDVVSFRMSFFDGQTGEHILNKKFNSGDRVIDLTEDWQVSQLSSSSAFVRADAAKEMHFSEKLAHAEDALEINKILLKKKTLGVMQQPVYWYRRRSVGERSAVQGSTLSRRFYHESLLNFSQGLLDYAKRTCGGIPKFIQQLVMYDLQWRITLPTFPAGLFTEEEIQDYHTLLANVLKQIDDEVILFQKQCWQEQKAFALRLKYGQPVRMMTMDFNNHPLAVGNVVLKNAEAEKIQIQFLQVESDRLRIEGKAFSLFSVDEVLDLQVLVNGSPVSCEISGAPETELILNAPAYRWDRFSVDIPLSRDLKELNIGFACSWNGVQVKRKVLAFGKFCPVTNTLANSYYAKNGWILTCNESEIQLTRDQRPKRWKLEWNFCRKLMRSNRLGSKKAVPIRMLAHVLRFFKHKPVWLIRDRVSKADDNGEAFFLYLREHHKKELNAYFVLSKDSVDYPRLCKVGHVLPYMGFRHKLLTLIADNIASSAGEDDVFNPFHNRREYYRDFLCNSSTVFLQHGITMNDLSEWLKREYKNLDGIVTSAVPERESFVCNSAYGYSEKNVWLTGFPRYDRLYHGKEKWITIAPTWRRSLVHPGNTQWEMNADFKDSEYYKFYRGLLCDERIQACANRLGYTLAFLPHPNIQSFADVFELPDSVKVCGLDIKYRDMYASSSLLVTDYSSVFFDFSYLGKPIVYTHFDCDSFWQGQIYDKGYFDYERDGFGEVEYDLESTVLRLIEYMENDCRLKDKYRKRIDDFFAFRDRNNCQRVYEKILELDRRNK